MIHVTKADLFIYLFLSGDRSAVSSSLGGDKQTRKELGFSFLFFIALEREELGFLISKVSIMGRRASIGRW